MCEGIKRPLIIPKGEQIVNYIYRWQKWLLPQNHILFFITIQQFVVLTSRANLNDLLSLEQSLSDNWNELSPTSVLFSSVALSVTLDQWGKGISEFSLHVHILRPHLLCWLECPRERPAMYSNKLYRFDKHWLTACTWKKCLSRSELKLDDLARK